MTGIVNDKDLLVIYDIIRRPHQEEITVRHQFSERSLTVTASVMLAVPSELEEVIEK
jgi:BarA-like signal transduction histidine kinase